MINDAAETYKNAYFEINYINVFSSGTPVEPSGTSSTAGGASGSAVPSSSAKPSGEARRNLDVAVSRLAWSGAVAGAVAAGLAVVV